MEAMLNVSQHGKHVVRINGNHICMCHAMCWTRTQDMASQIQDIKR